MNTNMQRFYFLSLFLTFTLLVQGQNYSNTPEYLYTQFDKEFYVAGEDLWFSVYFANPQSRQSEIVYAELYSPMGKEVAKVMLKVEGNRAFGDFVLPPNLATGYYKFRTYTRWNLNFTPQEVFLKDIAIYNAESSQAKISELPVPTYSPAAATNLNASLEKKVFKPREKVRVKLSSQAQGVGFASISVTDLRYLSEKDKGSLSNFSKQLSLQKAPSISTGQQVVEPEKLLKKTFMLRHPDTEEYVNSNFVMGFVKQTQQKMIRVAENGIVDFLFDPFYESTVVQVFDANPFQDTYIPLVEPINKEIALAPPPSNTATPPLNEAVNYYIQEYKKRFQIGKLFGNMELIRAKQIEVSARKFQATNTYRVDDFISLPDLEEFVNQAVPPVNVKEKKVKGSSVKKPVFKLYVPHKEANTNNKVVKKPPLLLVNDYFTYDTEAVLRLPWENVETLEVYNSVANLPKQFGPIGEFGVIALNTRDRETPSSITDTGNNLLIPGFYSPRLVNSMDYESRTYLNSKTPDFRPMMYWNPQIPLRSGAESEVVFSMGDQPGTYLIRIDGILDNGTQVSSELLLEVALQP